MRSRFEFLVERFILNSRWLLTPFYIGLVLVVVALGITFFPGLWHLYATVITAGEAEVVLMVLSLVDVVLVANLLIMVVISGYGNFVSALDVTEDDEDVSRSARLGSVALTLAFAAPRLGSHGGN